MTEATNDISNENDKQYVVLARKYRPQNFDELLGQDALVRTLTNAIKNNRLHHAYILTGIRGVGKNDDGPAYCQSLKLHRCRRQWRSDGQPLRRL